MNPIGPFADRNSPTRECGRGRHSGPARGAGANAGALQRRDHRAGPVARRRRAAADPPDVDRAVRPARLCADPGAGQGDSLRRHAARFPARRREPGQGGAGRPLPAWPGSNMEAEAPADPWNRPSPSRAFAVDLHAFAWMPGLMLQGERGRARGCAADPGLGRRVLRAGHRSPGIRRSWRVGSTTCPAPPRGWAPWRPRPTG